MPLPSIRTTLTATLTVGVLLLPTAVSAVPLAGTDTRPIVTIGTDGPVRAPVVTIGTAGPTSLPHGRIDTRPDQPVGPPHGRIDTRPDQPVGPPHGRIDTRPDQSTSHVDAPG